MSVKELIHERTVDFELSVITAKRLFFTTWVDRYSISGVDPHRIPVFNESHIDALINTDLKKCRVVKKTVVEHPEGGTGIDRYALVTVEYSTRPTGTVSITANTISFADTNPDTILDSGSGFIDAGFKPGVITVAGSVSNDGSYTIDSNGVVAGVLTLVVGDTLINEAAGATVTITQENSQIVRTLELSAQVLMQEVDNKRGFQSTVNLGATIAFVDSNPDTITDSANGFGSFNVNDKIVVSGSDSNDGVYKITAVAAGTLTLNPDETLTAESAGEFVTISQGALLEKPISLFFPQGVLTISKRLDSFPFLSGLITATTIAFVDSNPDTITDSGNGFVAAGFVPGQKITVSGTTLSGNDGTFTVNTVTAGILTLIAGDSLIAEAAGATVTISQGILTGLIGKLNDATFYGKPSETFMFLGASIREDVNETGDSQWIVDFRFQYNETGWNDFWNKSTSSFQKLNPEPYETGDFDILDVEFPT